MSTRRILPRSARLPRWEADDQAWFSSHPREQFRLREPFRGELVEEYPDAPARLAAARRCGLMIGLIIWIERTGFVKDPGTFIGVTDDGILDDVVRLDEPWGN